MRTMFFEVETFYAGGYGGSAQVSIPLRGKGRLKLVVRFFDVRPFFCFNPLAGKRSVETIQAQSGAWEYAVSIPLRGKGRLKPAKTPLAPARLSVFQSPCGEKVG